MNIKTPDQLMFNNYMNSLIKSQKAKLNSTKSQNNKQEKDKRVQQILNKFNAGLKLTAAELQYLSVHAPEEYEKVKFVLAEREQLEKKMEEAETKQEAMDNAYTGFFIPAVPSNSPSEGISGTARNNQLNNAVRAYRRTMDYQNKPDNITALLESNDNYISDSKHSVHNTYSDDNIYSSSINHDHIMIDNSDKDDKDKLHN